jgi:hypothetical protein
LSKKKGGNPKHAKDNLADDKIRIGTSKIQVQSNRILGFPAQWYSKQCEELEHTYPDPCCAFSSQVVF